MIGKSKCVFQWKKFQLVRENYRKIGFYFLRNTENLKYVNIFYYVLLLVYKYLRSKRERRRILQRNLTCVV
jgi:hypothetical protein